MSLTPHKKILTKAAFMVMLCNMLTAADRADLQRRDSFKKLEDFRAAEKKKAGDKVLYEERDGGFRPYGLMDDVTEAGQSSQKIKAIKDERSAQRQKSQASGFFSLKDFMQLNDQQIQNVRAVFISLSESYFGYNDQRGIDLKRKLEKNPNIIVVLDCRDATQIDDNCLNDINNMRRIKIMRAEKVKKINNGFLSNCTGLKTIDLKHLSNVENIGNFFLAQCHQLTALDLTPLSNVKEIGNGFLGDCKKLTTLDLTPLSNVTNIGNFFLAECAGLTTLDLSPLSNVENIGNFFLAECAGLTRESVTVPQNWRFERLIQPHLIRNPVAASTQNAHPAPAIVQRMIDDLRRRHIDPKRAGSDYTPVEYGAASSLLQGAGELPEDYLRRLEEVFSRARAAKLLEDIINAEDNSSDSDGSDH